jgi:hypothetical protein
MRMAETEAPAAARRDPALMLQARLYAIADRLDQRRIELERAHDSRCVFTCAYVLMTERLAGELPNGEYRDAGWIVTLAEAFADLYFEALDASAANRDPGPAWGRVFDAIDRRHSSVLEDLVFSMSAHIIHDLPHALCRVGLGSGDGSHIYDFHAVNWALGREVDEIEGTISRRYASWVRWIDRLGGHYSLILTDYGLRMARGMAWYNALRLLDPASMEEARASIERSPAVLVEEVLNPPRRSLRTILRLARFLVGLLRRWPRNPSLPRERPPAALQALKDGSRV